MTPWAPYGTDLAPQFGHFVDKTWLWLFQALLLCVLRSSQGRIFSYLKTFFLDFRWPTADYIHTKTQLSRGAWAGDGNS
jgi:hypothetical protein